MRVISDTLFNQTTMGGTTQVFSKIISLENMYVFALHYIAAGTTASGSLQMQVSCEPGFDGQGTNISQWANLDTATAISTLGQGTINKDGVGYKWLRVSYTPASGNGTFTVYIHAKGN